MLHHLARGTRGGHRIVSARKDILLQGPGHPVAPHLPGLVLSAKSARAPRGSITAPRIPERPLCGDRTPMVWGDDQADEDASEVASQGGSSKGTGGPRGWGRRPRSGPGPAPSRAVRTPPTRRQGPPPPPARAARATGPGHGHAIAGPEQKDHFFTLGSSAPRVYEATATKVSDARLAGGRGRVRPSAAPARRSLLAAARGSGSQRPVQEAGRPRHLPGGTWLGQTAHLA